MTSSSPKLEEEVVERLDDCLSYLHTVSDDTAVGFSAPMPVAVLEDAQRAVDDLEALLLARREGDG